MLLKTFMVVSEPASTERLTEIVFSPGARLEEAEVPVGLIDSGSQLERLNNLFKLARSASSFL